MAERSYPGHWRERTPRSAAVARDSNGAVTSYRSQPLGSGRRSRLWEVEPFIAPGIPAGRTERRAGLIRWEGHIPRLEQLATKRVLLTTNLGHSVLIHILPSRPSNAVLRRRSARGA